VHFLRQKNPRGSAIIVHGYYDHVGLYGHLIRYCLARNLNVVSLDLPGHGLSSGERASIMTFDEYVQALVQAIERVKPYLPKPWYLFGQSMGGAIAMELLLGQEAELGHQEFDEVVLLAPLVRPHRWPLGRVFYHLVKPFVATRPRSFSENSEDLEFLKFLREKDALQADVLPVQWVTAMVQWMNRFKGYHDKSFSPLIIQGQNDSTVDWRYNMKQLEKQFQPRIHYIPEGRHHLVNESEAVREKMFQHLDQTIGWKSND